MASNKKIDYVEFPAADFNAIKKFYSDVFGWVFTDYGPEYTSFTDGKTDGGFYQSTAVSNTKHGAVLVVIYARDLEATLESVTSAGGTIAKEIFSFPSGRRFHFYDPHGNELAVWTDF